MQRHLKHWLLATAIASSSFYSLAADKQVSVYTTAKDSNLRLSLSDTLSLKPAQQYPETDIAVIVNPDIRYQKFIGIGGAVTDASAEVFAKLNRKKQNEFLQAYYNSDKGIGYTLLRTTIHSSDFSSGSYTYIKEGDKELTSFSIDHDRKYRLPLIKKVLKAAGGEITTYVSPWSAPAFMKDTNNMLRGGKLLPEYNAAWALYYTKFIKAYEKEGVPIWGLTVQNEPMAKQTWESMIYTAEDERDFLKNHLGPTLKNEGLGDKKIIVWDHNRDLISHRAHTIMSDPEAAKYVWGIGFHWYETWTGGQPMYKNVADVGKAYPNVNLMLTEATVEKFNPERYQYWPNGERYGDSLINDFNAGAVAWTDWNILLDDKGGPNHVGNFCFSPIHADAKGELIYTPSYYYLGHFSKFIKPSAQRVSAVASRSVLQTTSFINQDNKLATVVMNNSDAAVSYRYYIGTLETNVTIPAHAIQTLVY
ncbi:glycosyl hydrolase [Cellvibrio sp. KY-GH-1]|uniref:glycoside hydrolase family 30 protein n=1 Tax=Cellvibrio sp. KY-GH-1 TaxID=2303332 RepID=UPI001245F9D1|nr:glycoside hydrolase family 30 protein [Cellvibrio sp. KY-GH-1]QEY17129.1 glycosyl hydrolase [Cellvibrio sp. KY-GH-1]